MTTEDIPFHTFPFRPLFGARISGAGMGGRDMAALIPSPGMGVWSWEYPIFYNVVRFFGFTGVSGVPGVVTSAARTTPRLVRFVHATRWNFGELECSRTHFLVMVTREDSRV